MPTLAPLDLDAHCIWAGFLDAVPAFATADGTLHRLDGGHQKTAVHDGLLSAASDGARLLTGGEDGKVVATGAGGRTEAVGEAGRKWVTAVALGPQGAVAWAAGRTAFVRLGTGEVRELVHARTAEGLAFAPKGCGWRWRATTARRCISPPRKANRPSSNGRARISR
jgi:hypothetical protein